MDSRLFKISFLKKSQILVVSTLIWSASIAFGQDPVGSDKIRSVATDVQFCSRLQKEISKLIPVESEDFRRRAVGYESAFRFMNNLMIGNLQRYVRLSEMMPLDESGIYSKRLINHETAFSAAMGTRPGAVVVLSVNELRQMPAIQENRDIILVVGDAAMLNQERVQLLISVAARKKLRIFALWTGSRAQSDQSSGRHWVESVATLTNGSFVDFSAGPAVCR